MQRNASLTDPLAAGDLGAAETSAYLNLNTLGSGAQSILNCLLDRTAEHDTVLELVSNAVCNQLGLDLFLAVMDLDDLDLGRNAGQLLNLKTERLDVGAALADYDAGTSSTDGNLDALGRTVDDDLGNGSVLQLRSQIIADGEVTLQVRRELLGSCVPSRPERLGNTKTDSVRINLLTTLNITT